MGTDLVLAVCGGGGNDTVAMVVVLAIAALYLLAVGAALNRAEDGTERAKLLGLLVIAVVVGGIVFRGLAGISIPFGVFILFFAAVGLAAISPYLTLAICAAVAVFYARPAASVPTIEG